MGDGNGNTTKALVIIAACAGALALLAVEFAIVPGFGPLWLILALVVIAAAGFCVWIILRELRRRGGRR